MAWLTIAYIKSPSDWYAVTGDKIRELGARSIISNQYNGSLFKALQAIYPEHNWTAKRPTHVKKGFWTDKENHKLFIKELASKLNIQKISDWYKVSVSQIKALGGRGVLGGHSSLLKVLATVYPEHNWEPYQFLRPHQSKKGLRASKAQILLYDMLVKLFPNNQVVLNYQHDDLRFSVSGKNKPFEYDVSTGFKIKT
jgi:hypothetical protein